MNTSLAKIVAKYLSEIEAAEPAARVALINEFDFLLTAIGKSNALTQAESAAESIVGRVESAAESTVAAIEHVL